MEYRLYHRTGHTVLLRIMQHSKINNKRKNVVIAYIDMTFQGSNIGALPSEQLITPWGAFRMSDRKNSRHLHMQWPVATCHVPRSSKRLEWMAEHITDERVVSWIKDLANASIGIDVIADLLLSSEQKVRDLIGEDSFIKRRIN